jgi:AmpD protein
MHVDTATGLFSGVRQVFSPFCDDRPRRDDLSLIIVHGISMPPAQYGGPWIEKLFTGNLPPDHHPYFRETWQLRVSAHLLVRRDGELVQFVACHRRAWHAGLSEYAGRQACNDFSIGIELEGADEEPYEAAQYEALGGAIGVLCAAYATLSPQRVVGHSDVAPGRKLDPGPAFDWPRLRRRLDFK